MSVISDEFFPDHLAKLQAIKNEMDEGKTNVHNTLGIWLDNALSDKNNNQIRELFIKDAENKNYLTKKGQRDITRKIASNLSVNVRLKNSNHAENINDDYDQTVL